MDDDAGPSSAAPSTRLRSAYAVLATPTLLVFLVALVARIARGLVGGGFTQPNGYDPGVYYAAAAGLANGKIPYRDFTLVHPPGMALLETPFAFLGRLTTDLTGYVAATLAIVVLASFGAVLVVRVARAMGLGERAAVAGGLLYALWTNSVAFEFSGRLEPVGNVLLLCGLLAFQRALDADETRARRLRFLAGAALGAAVCIKLWWLLPIAAFLGWQLGAERRVRQVFTVAVGGASALVLVNLPFLLLSGRNMWDMVVRDQLARSVNQPDRLQTFSYLTVGHWSPHLSPGSMRVAVVLGGLVLAVLVQRCWHHGPARAVVVVLAAQCVQIWFQPVWFPFYADFVTVALCLVVAAAFGTPKPVGAKRLGRRSWLRRNWLPATMVVALAANTTAFLITWEAGPDASPTPFPRGQLSAAVADAPCVMTDQPMGQIQLNALSRSFQNDCPNWVDPVGRRLRFNRVVGQPTVPGATLAWNKLVSRYLASGDVLILTRPPAAVGLTPSFFARLVRGGIAAEEGGYTVYRVAP